MPMVLVIIILVAWAIILGPNLMKRRARTVGGISSISHFHRQLRVLEHSSPEPLVAPAYRLRAVDGSGTPVAGGGPEVRVAAPKLSVVGADQLPRPALAFLGEPRAGSAPESAPVASPTGPVPPSDGPPLSPAGSLPRPTDAPARARARRRRRDTLGVLALVFTVTLMIGFLPGATVAWALTLVSGLALSGYVALLVRMRQMAEERERKLHYLRPPIDPADPIGLNDPIDLAELTGARDDVAARRTTRASGRDAHPSHQAAVAR